MGRRGEDGGRTRGWSPAIRHQKSTWNFPLYKMEKEGGDGGLSAMRAGGSRLVYFFGLPPRSVRWWVPLGVMEEKKGGKGFY